MPIKTPRALPVSASMSPSVSTPKIVLNLLAAFSMSSLSLWLATTDFLYPGDPLFQVSGSLPAFAIILGMITTAAIVLAIFPKRIIIGANVLLLLRGAIGYPFNAWTDNATAASILSFSLLALSLFYLVGSARKMMRIEHRPWVQLRHTLTILGVGLVLGILSIPATLLGYTHAMENLFGDYVHFSPKAVSLVERVFRKGNQTVYLVGMMHIGEGGYYKDLKKRLDAPLEEGKKRLVLTEGVSDSKGILPEGFASGKTYARWARSLGLEMQHSLKTRSRKAAGRKKPRPTTVGVDFKNADIDVGELDSSHQDTLVTLLELLDETDPVKLMFTTPEGVTGLDVEELLMEGLIGRRNDALMTSFEEFGPDYVEIFIPWGAAHLTDVEARLRALGFEEVDEIVRPVVTFWK